MPLAEAAPTLATVHETVTASPVDAAGGTITDCSARSADGAAVITVGVSVAPALLFSNAASKTCEPESARTMKYTLPVMPNGTATFAEPV
ncbi:MAG: hypothetical protein CALGDGBN_01932 [Pseudomonadales bacterium]|nr:hypothetical protein [Pseudomonadales bacterium]